MSVLEIVFLPCPYCENKFQMVEELIGKETRCGKCHSNISIPATWKWEDVVREEIEKQELEQKIMDVDESMQNIQNGEMKTLQCRHDREQLYMCYLPTKYDPAKEWPILYCFSPGDNATHYKGAKYLEDQSARHFLSFYKDACEELGWIAVCSRNSKAGSYCEIDAASKAVFWDTHQRFRIAPRRCYASGFSAGSGAAFRIASMYPNDFAGVIPIAVATSWDEGGYITLILPKTVAVFFIIGNLDLQEFVKRAAIECLKMGHQATARVFPGDHRMPPKKFIQEAILWLEKST